MKFSLRILLLLALPLFLHTSCDEEPAYVDILVKDAQNRAIENARITFYTQPGNSVLEGEVYTDDLGKADHEFDFLATLSVYARKDNYYGQTVLASGEVTLVRGETTLVELTLIPPIVAEEED